MHTTGSDILGHTYPLVELPAEPEPVVEAPNDEEKEEPEAGAPLSPTGPMPEPPSIGPAAALAVENLISTNYGRASSLPSSCRFCLRKASQPVLPWSRGATIV